MWTVEWERKALKDAKKLDKSARQRIVNYLEKQVLVDQNPYQFGKPLIISLTPYIPISLNEKYWGRG